MPSISSPSLALETITQRIFILREQKVLLDADLAALYGVDTRRLNEQVRRNRDRFPQDFIFELTRDEFNNLMSQFATSSLIAENDEPASHGGRRKLPMAFTEHGAIMAATVLSSPRAVEVSVYVVRAFLKLRELVATHQGLAKRLDALEAKLQEKTESLAMQHDTFSRNTRAQLKQVMDALRELMSSAESPVAPKRPIGFVHPQDVAKFKAKVVKVSAAKKTTAVKAVRKK
jgi:ORF6N domain